MIISKTKNENHIRINVKGNFQITKEDTHFHTMQSIEALYLARPDVTWKLVLAVCFGTGTLMTTPRANIFAPKTLFT